jgi:riboflavin synthase
MFTGIVEIMGTVVAVSENDTTESGGNGWTVTVGDATCILDDCHIGDSISINGNKELLRILSAIFTALVC